MTEVRAVLTARAGYGRKDPDQVSLRIGESIVQPLTRVSEGEYSGVWRPEVEGNQVLWASYPDAALASDNVIVDVDLTGPQLAVSIPLISRVGLDPLSDIDPELPSARKRDEIIPVVVCSSDEDFDEKSIGAELIGLAAPDTVSTHPIHYSSTTIDGGTQRCGRVDVDFADPEMQVFSGVFQLQVNGKDKVGNLAAYDAGVPVTRWKWSFDAGTNPVYASPVVGHKGSIYLAKYLAPSGDSRVFSVSPTGSINWVSSLIDVIEGTPAVGKWDGLDERLYVGGRLGDYGGIWGLKGSTGESIGDYSPQRGFMTSNIVIADTTISGRTPETTESAVFYLLDNLANDKVVVFRPFDAVSNFVAYGPVARAGSPQNGIATDGRVLYYGSEGNGLNAYRFDSGSISSLAGWPVSLTAPVRSVAVIGSTLFGALSTVGTANGGLFRIPTTTNTPSVFNQDSPVMGFSIDGRNEIIYHDESKRVRRISTDLVAPNGSVGALTESSNTSPLLGSDGLIYTVTSSGTVNVWNQSLTGAIEWRSPSLGAVSASPNIDCARSANGDKIPGRPGVLYVATETGKLYAIVVDSRGIDTTAAWPRYQHDPRSTGNSLTSLAEFACP